MLLARISGRDDHADGFLIEAFETAMALEIFQVASESAVFHELLELLARY